MFYLVALYHDLNAKVVNSFMKLNSLNNWPSVSSVWHLQGLALIIDRLSHVWLIFFSLLGPVTWLWKLMLSYLQHPKVRSGGTSTSLKTATGEHPFFPIVDRRRYGLILFFLLKVYPKWEFTHDLPTTRPQERWSQSTKTGFRFTWLATCCVLKEAWICSLSCVPIHEIVCTQSARAGDQLFIHVYP